MAHTGSLPTIASEILQLHPKHGDGVSGNEDKEVHQADLILLAERDTTMGQEVDLTDKFRSISPPSPTMSDAVSEILAEGKKSSKPLVFEGIQMEIVPRARGVEQAVFSTAQPKLRLENDPNTITIHPHNAASPIKKGKGLEMHPTTPTNAVKHRIDLDESNLRKMRKVDLQSDIIAEADRVSISPLPPSHGVRNMSPKALLEEKARKKTAAKEALEKARSEKEVFKKKIVDAEDALSKRLAEEEEEVNSWLDWLRDPHAYIP
jgi:hypothetical protein